MSGDLEAEIVFSGAVWVVAGDLKAFNANAKKKICEA
jgi:hypothetical protein